jgi:propanol-preferring alcohol dehydrogenase
MRAMVLSEQGKPLELRELERPEPGHGELRVAVKACGICRTDLHVVDGDLREPALPLVPGHQIVGRVDALGPGVEELGVELSLGDRVGIPWLGSTCGRCRFCRMERENLCDHARFTGYQIDGGFADYAVADARFCFPIPENYPDLQAAPLLCAGLIGYRAWRMVPDEAERVGLYGFGSAAHILTQLAVWEGREIHAFTRPGDSSSQRFARKLGARWAGGSDERPEVELDAAVLFAPVGELVPISLRASRKGATIVCAGIHMSDIPSFPYEILWGERVVRSVANLERRDGLEFLRLAPRVGIQTQVTTFELERANEALDALREGRFDGSGVLVT